jgi:preprotein translocase subunit YajC
MALLANACWSLTSVLAQCGPTGEGGEGGGSPLSGLWMIALIFVIFYFLLIRPQQKKQKQHQKMLEAIKKGDKVVTSGGMYGTVIGVKDNVVVIKIAENVKVEFAKGSISQVVSKEQ